jgi:hypothetical protein
MQPGQYVAIELDPFHGADTLHNDLFHLIRIVILGYEYINGIEIGWIRITVADQLN